MENKKTFTYQYSAEQNREVERIRSKYLSGKESPMDRLKRLDRKVQMAGQVQSLCLGIIGSLIFGIGMCFGLDVFGGSDWLTVLFCALGTFTMIPAYPVYRRISNKTRDELAPEIISLSERIMKA